jgi:hypothetical protein
METTNYGMFKFMPTNRRINQKLVDRLISSIKKIGYIKSRPVIINKAGVIIDGQHRYWACKQLGLPIYYEIEKVDMNKAMLELNMNQSVWKLTEYVESWANYDIECYKRLLEFDRTYKLGISNSIKIIKGLGHDNGKDIREGKDFKINTNSEEIADFIIKCKPFIHFYKNGSFVHSVLVLFKKTDAKSRKKILDNMASVRMQASVNNYLIVFENIINKHNRNAAERVTLCA